jgi:hypothetical protein
VRDDENDAALAGGLTVDAAGITLVTDGGPRGEVEASGMTVEVFLQMDLGGEAAARAAGRLVLLIPLAPAAET